MADGSMPTRADHQAYADEQLSRILGQVHLTGVSDPDQTAGVRAGVSFGRPFLPRPVVVEYSEVGDEQTDL